MRSVAVWAEFKVLNTCITEHCSSRMTRSHPCSVCAMLQRGPGPSEAGGSVATELPIVPGSGSSPVPARSCTALRAPDASFDLVVSFETLEHVAAQEALVAGFARVLSADGVLVISSPDKRTYSDATGFHNEFHVRELYRDELLALLQAHFPHVRLYGQKLLFESA